MIERFILSVLAVNFVAWLFLTVFVAHATYDARSAFPACMAVLAGFAAYCFWRLLKEWRTL